MGFTRLSIYLSVCLLGYIFSKTTGQNHSELGRKMPSDVHMCRCDFEDKMLYSLFLPDFGVIFSCE